jgi:hypothetical protein
VIVASPGSCDPSVGSPAKNRSPRPRQGLRPVLLYLGDPGSAGVLDDAGAQPLAAAPRTTNKGMSLDMGASWFDE